MPKYVFEIQVSTSIKNDFSANHHQEVITSKIIDFPNDLHVGNKIMFSHKMYIFDIEHYIFGGYTLVKLSPCHRECPDVDSSDREFEKLKKSCKFIKEI